MTNRAHSHWFPRHQILYWTVVPLVGGLYLWCVQAANSPFEWRHDKSEVLGNGIVRLISEGPLTAGPYGTAEVVSAADGRDRVRLEYRPSSAQRVVQWNRHTVLQHPLPSLVTSPSQVTIGMERTGFSPQPTRFPGEVTLLRFLLDAADSLSTLR